MSKAPKKTPTQSHRQAYQRLMHRPPAEFDEVLRLIDAARGAGRRRRQHDADRALLEHRRVHQPEDRRRRLGQGNGRGPGRDHPATPSRHAGAFPPQPLADEAVLRDLPGPAKTRQHC